MPVQTMAHWRDGWAVWTREGTQDEFINKGEWDSLDGARSAAGRLYDKGLYEEVIVVEFHKVFSLGRSLQ